MTKLSEEQKKAWEPIPHHKLEHQFFIEAAHEYVDWVNQKEEGSDAEKRTRQLRRQLEVAARSWVDCAKAQEQADAQAKG